MTYGDGVFRQRENLYMKGFIRISGVLIAALSIFFTGCGTDMVSLTEEEENVIAAYASGAVAKANKYQLKGLTYLSEEEEVGEDVTAEEPEQENAASEGQITVGEATAENTGQESPANTATLTEVLNIPSVTAEYQGYQVKDNYMEGDYFALNAEPGNTYLILSIRLTNTSGEPIDCSILEQNLGISLLINGESVGRAMATILLNDFSTYVKTLEASAGEDTILIFEIPKEAVEDIQTLSIDIEASGTLYHIDLE